MKKILFFALIAVSSLTSCQVAKYAAVVAAVSTVQVLATRYACNGYPVFFNSVSSQYFYTDNNGYVHAYSVQPTPSYYGTATAADLVNSSNGRRFYRLP